LKADGLEFHIEKVLLDELPDGERCLEVSMGGFGKKVICLQSETTGSAGVPPAKN